MDLLPVQEGDDVFVQSRQIFGGDGLGPDTRLGWR
jgi:hypothetical protein